MASKYGFARWLSSVLKDSALRRRFKRWAAVLSVFVVVGTLLALTLPAITMNRELACNMEEHTHEAACFAAEAPPVLQCSAQPHIHGSDCFDATGERICGQADFLVHTHDSQCYGPTGSLVCPLPQVKEHTHEAGCFETTEVVQDPGHTHTDACYAWTTGTGIVCTEEERPGHLHKDVCYDGSGELICTTTEDPGHMHGPECFEKIRGDLTCTEEERPPVTEPGEPVLICTQEEIQIHSHTFECYENREVLAEDVQPTDTIVLLNGDTVVIEVLVCTRTVVLEHPHDTDCFVAGEPDLICQIPEHSHTEKCVVLTEEEQQAVTETATLMDSLPAVAEVEAALLTMTPEEQATYRQTLQTAAAQAQTAYDSLNDTQKAHIETYDRLAALQVWLQPETPEPPTAPDTLEFAADGYTTAVDAPAAAKLPADTVVVARPIFDDTGTAAVGAAQKSGKAYAQEIQKAVTWGQVSGIKLYNITLISGNETVQPAVPVKVTTTFEEPLVLKEGEVVYGVHIGDKGVELLPAETQRDASGNITAITHTQSSFSPSGYVLVHIPNPHDIGPDVILVHYCIWVDDQWIIAGSTRTGWYGADIGDITDWSIQEQRDCITLDQMDSVLGPYGLDVNDHETLCQTVWYQRAENANTTIYHDTTPYEKTITGADGTQQTKWVFPLSANIVKDDGYHIYYVPGGTESGASTYPRNSALGADLKPESKYFTMTVRDMNNLVYSQEETNDPAVFPQAKVYRYGDPVEMTVRANIKNGTNVGWMWVNDRGSAVNGHNPVLNGVVDNRFGYRDNGDGTETYTFTGILGRTTLIPYSVAMDGAAQTTDKQVDIAVYLDGQWQKVGQLNLMYQKDGVCEDANGNPQWFVTAGQIYTILKNFGFDPGNYSPDDVATTGHKFTHADEAFDPAKDMVMHANAVNQVMGDGNKTVAIGLGGDDVTNFTLFYMPGSSEESITDVDGVGNQTYAKGDKIIGDRFYSVKVRDDYQLIYYGYETDNFLVYVQEGGNVTVSVQNALNVLWSVRGHEDLTATQADGFNTYEFRNVVSPIIIEASSLNPTFNVQYYATIVRYEVGNSTAARKLDLIDTRGKTLPLKNQATQDTISISLNVEPGMKETMNNGDDSNVYSVKTYEDVTQIYKETEYVYDKAHLWKNIDKLWQNDNYEIRSISILKEGADPNSEKDEDWWTYLSENNGANITFTNLASEENIQKNPDDTIQQGANHTILLTEGMIIRLHYEYVEETDFRVDNVTFYDYDITSGKDANGRWNTKQKGINSYYTGTNTANIYGFGNINCQSGQGAAQWNGNFLNASNAGKFSGCTFGLVTGLDANGNLKWGTGIKAPDIFGKSNITGKTVYEGGSLTFNRRGDVYTLSAANSTVGSRTGLEYFFNPSDHAGRIYDGNKYKAIYTNNFWVVDNATNRKDTNWGKYNDKIYMAGYNDVTSSPNQRGAEITSQYFPVADDGNNHNYFFGMQYSISFNVTEDYTGPLEYIFFGDDDMWVFLDGKLICDIGGVHSAVGQYVDLRDYLPVDGPNTAGNHTLRFFYTERGASGSTCWMSFTLPSVTSTTVEEGTAQLQIAKEVVDRDGIPMQMDEEYEFIVNLYTDSSKKQIINTPFSVEIKKADGTVEYYATASGKSIYIGAGDTATILGMPVGTWYVIEEAEDNRFLVEANGKEGRVFEDKAQQGLNLASFTNVYRGYMLPNTGGGGTLLYTVGGLSMMSSAILLYSHKRKRRKEEKT